MTFLGCKKVTSICCTYFRNVFYNMISIRRIAESILHTLLYYMIHIKEKDCSTKLKMVGTVYTMFYFVNVYTHYPPTYYTI